VNNIIELKFKPIDGNLCDVEFSAGIEGKLPAIALTAKVPNFNPHCYDRYQAACRQLTDRTRIKLKREGTISNQDLAEIRKILDDSVRDLLHEFNCWGELPEFVEIARSIADRSENLRVTISTESADLRKLPFHKWSLFPEHTEAIFSGIEAKVMERTRHPERIRILVILGDNTGIDIDKDRQTIADYCQQDAELVVLAQPNRENLTTTLADARGWDIIFFSGHSDTADSTGRIYINATDSLTMNELKDVLKPAIEHRVQIAIFNSCDGLGITPVLERLNIDRLIVMREPIPDLVAQEFLKSFLKSFTQGARFDDAVKAARQHLVGFEGQYPYASWLPIVIQNRLVSSPTWQSLGKIRSPYKGLAAFTEADAANFYGREETIERYANLVGSVPLLPIIGASGSGKSSLVQAGLIPYLKQDPDSDWQILTLRPGRNPFDALARAIAQTDRANLDTIQLDLDLESDRGLLTQKLAQIRIPQHRILLFIDQFEELFTQLDDEAARQVFLQSLADAVSNAPNFVLVFTLRNDFLPTLQRDRQDNDFRQLLERYSPQLVGSMSRDRLKAAITKPVETLGVEFEGGLVDRLLQDVGTAEGSLPLLQLVLDLLWKNARKRQLTHESYEAIGGSEGMNTVLIKLAEDVYDGFVKENKIDRFQQVFLRLIAIGEINTYNTRRIATRTEIGEANWREIVVPLSTSTRRLLKTNLDEKGEEIVEVIHETLIRSWERLTGWIDRHRHDLERIAEIETAASKWDRNQRARQDLWSGKKFKDAQKFSKTCNALIPFSPIAKDFLVAGSKQQRWSLGGFIAVGAILTGLVILAQDRSRQAQINMADSLSNSAISLVNAGQHLDGLIRAIEAGKILQAQRASTPDTIFAFQKILDNINERNRFLGHEDSVTSVSISPDGKTLASSSSDKTIKLWDLATGKEIHTLLDHQEYVSSVSFSPDGQTLASSSWDKTIKLWNLATRQEIRTFFVHKNGVNSVSFSPDGQTLASSSADNTIKLWQIRTGRDLDTLMEESCNLVRAYLENNSLVSESKKRLCDGIGTKK
jgi:AAA ATPase domain/WD domain, G-beta repeat